MGAGIAQEDNWAFNVGAVPFSARDICTAGGRNE
jgi:hypothetical protein